MVKIGISVSELQSDRACGNYLRWLKSSHVDIATELLHHADRNYPRNKFLSCEALVLSGGGDVMPSFYGQSAIPEVKDCKKERDEFEMELLEIALERKIPVLGICRGIQIANVFLGGTLIQDIEKTGKPGHRQISSEKDREHDIMIRSDSMLLSVLKQEKINVNSSHHQAIDKPGRGLKISAVSSDGISEAAEWEHPDGKPPLLLVQWHPERMDFNHPASNNILNAFLGCTNRSKHENFV